MKWNDKTFDEQCDALCMLIDPAEELAADKALLSLVKEKKLWQAARRVLTEHREAVRHILAAFDGCDPSAVRLNLLSLPGKIVEVLSNEDLIRLFTLQLPGVAQMYSGSASAGSGEGSPAAGQE